MNPLVTLLLAAAATGADTQPVVPETVTPVAAYTYTDAEPDSHPGFFGRIRNALGPKSSSSSGTYSVPAYQYDGAPARSVVTTETAVPVSPRFIPSGSSPEPPLADTVPVTTQPPAIDMRPVAPPAVVTQPSYTYPAPAVNATNEPSRTRLFPHLRKWLGGSQPSSQSYQALPEDVIAAPQYVAPPAPVAAPAPPAPVVQGQPRRMPIGNP